MPVSVGLSAWLDSWLLPGCAGWGLDQDPRRVHCPLPALHGDSGEHG